MQCGTYFSQVNFILLFFETVQNQETAARLCNIKNPYIVGANNAQFPEWKAMQLFSMKTVQRNTEFSQ